MVNPETAVNVIVSPPAEQKGTGTVVQEVVKSSSTQLPFPGVESVSDSFIAITSAPLKITPSDTIVTDKVSTRESTPDANIAPTSHTPVDES